MGSQVGPVPAAGASVGLLVGTLDAAPKGATVDEAVGKTDGKAVVWTDVTGA